MARWRGRRGASHARVRALLAARPKRAPARRPPSAAAHPRRGARTDRGRARPPEARGDTRGPTCESARRRAPCAAARHRPGWPCARSRGPHRPRGRRSAGRPKRRRSSGAGGERGARAACPPRSRRARRSLGPRAAQVSESRSDVDGNTVVNRGKALEQPPFARVAA